MTPRVKRAHHIDFVVRDLAAASRRFARILGIEPGPREVLEERGVELVRFELSNLWLVLVEAVSDDSPVRTFLDTYGEGFFHIAYEVEDVEAEADRLTAEGIELVNRKPRRGVEGWQLVDIDMAETFGVYTQLVQENDHD